jgi:WD40 repeat protein
MEQSSVVPPGVDELQTYSLGKCDPRRAAQIEAFLTDGPDCSAILAQAPDDALLRHLRGATELRPATSLPADVPGYDVLAEVGRGGMGVVYKARHRGLNRLVALKMLLTGSHAGPGELARFRQEAETVARLQHPNIVQVYEVGAHNGLPYLALEYVGGGNLAQRTAGAPQPPRDAAALVELLARAVDHAHQQGVIHRDLKPANVLLTADGAPKLSDFGLARLAGEAPGLTATGAVLGTPGYLAPEQAGAGRVGLGPATDVYGLGAVLYYLLTGRPPVQAATPASLIRQTLETEPVPPARLRPGVPRDLGTICLKCLQKEPGQRYATAGALAEDLRRFQAGEPVAARPVGWAGRGLRWCRRNPALATLGTAAVLLLLAVTAVSVVFAVDRGRAAANLQAEKDRAESALKRSRSNEALLTCDRAVRIGEEGEDGQAPDAARALLWLARAAELAPDDDEPLRYLVRASWDAWQAQVCPLLGTLAVRPKAGTRFAAWSPDGTQVLTGTDDGLEIWDVRTGRRLRARPQAGKVTVVAWSPDGRRAAGGAPAGVPVRVWDLDGDTLRELPVPAGVNDLSFSPDSKQLAAACDDGRVCFWDARTGDAAGAPLALSTNEPATAVSFHPDGRRVLCTTSLTLRQWDTVTHKAVGPAIAAPEKGFLCARYSADGARFCATCRGGDGWWALYETDTGRELIRRIHTEVQSIHLSPDGKRLVLGQNACRADVWDLTGATLPFVITGHQRQVSAAVLSPDGRAVLTADDGGRVRLSLVAGGLALPPFALPFRGTKETFAPKDKYFTVPGVRCLAVSPDGRRLFAAGWDRNGLLVDAADGAVQGEFRGHEAVITMAAFLPDGKRLLSSGADGTVRLWDAATCRLLQTWPIRRVRYLCVSPDGGRAVVEAGNQGCLLELGGADGGRLAADHLWGVSRGAAFLPDGKGVLVGRAFDVGLWDPTTGNYTATPLWQTSSISAVAVDPAGRRAATGAWNMGQIWDLRTGAPVGPPLRHLGREHEERIKALAFAPDGRLVAGLAFDGEVRFWDAATGRPVGPPLYVPDTGNALAFQGDGAVLFTASSTPLVYRWRVPRPVTEEIGLLTLRTQVLTGMELDAEGVVRPLDPDTWRERRRRLEELDAGTGP